MMEPTLDNLEGRLIAQRKVLALILSHVAGQEKADGIWAFLAERSVFQDGEEDPGVLPSRESGIEGAISDELRLIVETAQRYHDEGM